MKLRNKKTGEIMQLSVKCENGGELRTFDLNTNTDKPITLAELNAEWEDYEEPKEYWHIDCDGEIEDDEYEGTSFDKDCKAIGNYFETKEEAEKAVEKLKAWKRLKDKGFRFGHWVTERDKKCGKVEFKCDDIGLSFDKAHEFFNDITLIFWSEK